MLQTNVNFMTSAKF